MALQGDITWTFYEVDENETEELILTHPDGSTEVIENPVTKMRTQQFTDVYIYIRSIQVHTMTVDNVKTEHVHFHISGYESKEARDADNDNFLFFENNTLLEYNHNENLWVQCYNFLKQRENFTDLTDI